MRTRWRTRCGRATASTSAGSRWGAGPHGQQLQGVRMLACARAWTVQTGHWAGVAACMRACMHAPTPPLSPLARCCTSTHTGALQADGGQGHPCAAGAGQPRQRPRQRAQRRGAGVLCCCVLCCCCRLLPHVGKKCTAGRPHAHLHLRRAARPQSVPQRRTGTAAVAAKGRRGRQALAGEAAVGTVAAVTAAEAAARAVAAAVAAAKTRTRGLRAGRGEGRALRAGKALLHGQ